MHLRIVYSQCCTTNGQLRSSAESSPSSPFRSSCRLGPSCVLAHSLNSVTTFFPAPRHSYQPYASRRYPRSSSPYAMNSPPSAAVIHRAFFSILSFKFIVHFTHPFIAPRLCYKFNSRSLITPPSPCIRPLVSAFIYCTLSPSSSSLLLVQPFPLSSSRQCCNISFPPSSFC